MEAGNRVNTQRQKNIEQQHRTTVRHITETLLRILASHEMEDWLGLDYDEMLEYAMKVLEQEYADVSKSAVLEI